MFKNKQYDTITFDSISTQLAEIFVKVGVEAIDD